MTKPNLQPFYLSVYPSQSNQRLTQILVIFPPSHLPISLLSIHFLSHPIIYLPIHPQIYSNTHSSNPCIYLSNFSTSQWPLYSSSIRLLINLSSTHPSSSCCTSSIHSSIHSPSILYLPRPHSMSNILMSFLSNSKLRKIHSQVLCLLSLLSKGVGADKGNGTGYHKPKQSFESWRRMYHLNEAFLVGRYLVLDLEMHRSIEHYSKQKRHIEDVALRELKFGSFFICLSKSWAQYRHLRCIF